MRVPTPGAATVGSQCLKQETSEPITHLRRYCRINSEAADNASDELVNFIATEIYLPVDACSMDQLIQIRAGRFVLAKQSFGLPIPWDGSADAWRHSGKARGEASSAPLGRSCSTAQPARVRDDVT
jgi:hypothetical protein